MAENDLTRRQFLAAAGRWAAVLGGTGLVLGSPEVQRFLELNGMDPGAAESLAALIKNAPVARYWVSSNQAGADCALCHAQGLPPGKRFKHSGSTVRCLLCAHRCTITEGDRGRCRARINVKGQLRSLVYGRPISEHVDPIEKKPFYHFLPGSQAYSLATSGCPLHCQFCQNWEISQARPEDYSVSLCSPETMAGRAAGVKAPVIAFTYNEPTVFTEYLTDIARAGRKRGLRSVIVSCGFMNEEPLKEMIDVLDAIKIDLKGFSTKFYREVAKAELEPVLRSIKQVAKSGRHLEIVNLVVPTLNDSDTAMTDLCKWVAGEVGPDVPLHFTRFHPDYQLQNLPPTPVVTLEKARETALKHGLHYPYVGNVPGHPGNHTYCPKCGKTVIERNSFFVTAMKLKDGACPACGTRISGIWK
jgi:pyruvate formate lyase activating enzyme